MILHFLVIPLLGYLAVELAFYWASLLAARRRRRPLFSPGWLAVDEYPIFAFLVACRNGEMIVPELAANLKSQDYPAPGRKMFLVADNCTDRTAEIAREAGFTVYERHDLETSGKGNAVSEALRTTLRYEPFDVLVVLDVDGRLERTFLHQAAAYFQAAEAVAVSCATFAKNPNESRLARIGNIIQGLLRLHQEGRRALRVDAALYGSHGYMLSRPALERLGWQTTTGQIAEDMELRLRCSLHGIPVHYAPELAVWNDVTADPVAAREQRRRWNSTYLPILFPYTGLLLREAVHGSRRCLESLFGLLWLPSFANLFLYLTAVTIVLTLASIFSPSFSAYALIAGVLWIADVAYFGVAFDTLHVRLGRQEWQGIVAHIRIRVVALVESLFFIHVRDWAPAPHRPMEKGK